MAYVTIEDVAQYLADNGYTTWADLTRQQTLTVEGMWTRLQSQYDSTRAIDGRYLGLGAYATEASIKAWVQSQGYLTSVPSPDMSSYATQAWVLGRGYLTSHQSLNDYATKTWVGMQMSSLASQVWVGNNFVSKATFDDLFEKVNIGTEQSPVYAIHAKLGLYSDSFISAGGVGSSGGGGGGGLTWDNLDAATNEQINASHLTTALAGYMELTGAQTISGAKTFSSQLTVSGRYCIGDWTQEDSYIRANDISVQGAYSLTFGLSDGSRQIYIEDGENIVVTGNVDVDGAMSVNGNVTANGFVKTGYNSADYLLTGNGGAVAKSTLLSGYATTNDLHSHSNKSVLDGITSNKVNNWDAAYGWGNHASAGYVTGYGNRPSIGNLSDNGVTWLPASAYVAMPLVYNAGAGYYQLNLSSYVKTSGNNTFTGSNTFTNSIELDDNAGIDFYDGTDTWNFFIDFSHDSRGSFCWCTAGQDIAWLDCDGVFHASGYQNSSDLRRKTLFGDVGLSVADIAAMPAVRFRWNSGRDTQEMHVGTIAQAWQTLLPEVVTQGSDGLLSMDYASAALVSVINVAQAVSDHERRILDLEAENRRLKTELEQLKSA